MAARIKYPIANGARFGKLTVLRHDTTVRGVQFWQCRCDCGVVVIVRKTNLLHRTRSCGCGHTKHGQSGTAYYATWRHMVGRCTQPNRPEYKHYGGRGIKVCDGWLSFENFYADMGPRPFPNAEIERKDNNGNYEPGNCVWATRRQQMRNTRRVRRLTLNGITLSLPDWADKLGMTRHTLRTRLNKLGWSVERALSEPLYFSKPRFPIHLRVKRTELLPLNYDQTRPETTAAHYER